MAPNKYPQNIHTPKNIHIFSDNPPKWPEPMYIRTYQSNPPPPARVYDQQTLRSACEYAQSDKSLCQSLEYFMSVKLLTEHHLKFLRFKGGCTGSSKSTLVKMPHCWKSHVAAQILKLTAW